jgi:hypothetical protein
MRGRYSRSFGVGAHCVAALSALFAAPHESHRGPSEK